MNKMSKKLSLWLYSHNLRDFMNNDIKIIRKSQSYLFISKKEKFIFKEIVTGKNYMSETQLFQVADDIFAEIINLRDEKDEIL